MAAPIKIMIVDDELQMTKLLKLIVEENLDCVVETFNDPQLALERLCEVRFDVLSLDFRMPGMNGIELIKNLQTVPNGVNLDIPVLMFTGFREEAERIHPKLIENLLFLEKPISDDRYIQNIKIAMQMGRRLQPNV